MSATKGTFRMKYAIQTLRAGLARGVLLLVGVLFTCVIHAEATAFDSPAMKLEGTPMGRKPDIVFLAPKLSEPLKAYRDALELIASQGMTLVNADLTFEAVQSEGIVPALRAANYRILQVKDVPWEDACSRLKSLFLVRKKARLEEEELYQPLCAFINEEVSPQVLAASLEQLMETDMLLVLLPEPKTPQSPMIVYWKNLVCPGAEDVQTIRNIHWVPTFAEFAGLPNPASVPEPSLVPLLTSVGYQRPLEASTIQLPLPKHRDVYTTLWYYTKLPKQLPWIPDYTCDDYKPERRHFVRGSLPLSRKALKNIPFRELDTPQGLYLRTTQPSLDILLPKGLSCVIRIKGKTVLDRWEPTEDQRWQMQHATPVPVDFFFLIPPNVHPLDLPFVVREPLLQSPFTDPSTPTDPEPLP